MDKISQFGLSNNPIESFKDWYQQAAKVEQNAEAMTVASVDSEGRPDARVLLYKGFVEDGIAFYSNYKSIKAQEWQQNAEACLVFYWHVSKKQVRLRGKVKLMSRENSIKYFQSRDRESQLASYISEQSAPIEDKAELLRKLHLAKEKFDSSPIPTPEHWGGYIFIPDEVEFFLYGEHRLNDRFLYKLSAGQWTVCRLQP